MLAELVSSGLAVEAGGAAAKAAGDEGAAGEVVEGVKVEEVEDVVELWMLLMEWMLLLEWMRSLYGGVACVGVEEGVPELVAVVQERVVPAAGMAMTAEKRVEGCGDQA